MIKTLYKRIQKCWSDPPQLIHDTASQSNHELDEDHKRSQVRIVKRMESIFVVLTFFVSTKSWPKQTALNKKCCKPEYVKGNKLIFGHVIVTSFFLFLDAWLTSLILVSLLSTTLPYIIMIPVSVINCISQVWKPTGGENKN